MQKYYLYTIFIVYLNALFCIAHKIVDIMPYSIYNMFNITTVRFNFPKVAGRDNRTVYLNYYCH